MREPQGDRRSFLSRAFAALGSLALVPLAGSQALAGHRRRRVRRHYRRVRRRYRGRSFSSFSYPSYPYYGRPYYGGPGGRFYGGYYRRSYRYYPSVRIYRGYGPRGYVEIRRGYDRSPLDLLEY
jgi:hypothetical protein